ncbi:dedicator of cytokinesis dock [Anaeramoeba flamelloides]|uniref:Dedicator of cytokinesis dock n=1 Tax=Anaeramoeba flamelloides TaxID=1746091 RepID=A0ABQ8YIQ3_9EUKA|nr:dedicator of cytokinesis dock [Anaeramoeba flamelloides]
MSDLPPIPEDLLEKEQTKEKEKEKEIQIEKEEEKEKEKIKLKSIEEEPLTIDFETQIKSLAVTREPLQGLVTIPEDDLQIRKIKKTFPTLKPNVPKLKDNDFCSPFVQESLKCFTRNGTQLIWKKRVHQTEEKEQYISTKEKFPLLEYEIDYEGSKAKKSSLSNKKEDKLQNAKLDEEFVNQHVELKLLQTLNEKELAKFNRERQKGWSDLFKVFSDLRIGNIIHDPRSNRIEYKSEPQPSYFFQGLKMNLPLETDPFFLTMYLVDIKKKVRVSECFRFQLNSEKLTTEFQQFLLEELRGKISTKNETMAKTCVLTLSNVNPNIYIIFRLEKVLHGSFDDSTNLYYKLNKGKVKQKKIDAEYKKARTIWSRMSRFHQPVAWSSIQLFDQDNNIKYDSSSSDILLVDNFVRSKEEWTDQQIFSTLSLAQKKGTPKKLKAFPCQFTFRFIPLNYGITISDLKDINWDLKKPITFPKILDMDGFSNISKQSVSRFSWLTFKKKKKVKKKTKKNENANEGESENENENEKTQASLIGQAFMKSIFGEKWSPKKNGPISLMVQEFPTELLPNVHQNYVNNLYIYPEQAFVGGLKCKKPHNIAIKIQYLTSDKKLLSKGESIFYGSHYEKMFVNCKWTSTQFKNKSPTFYDEIKLKLPPAIGPYHHILFTYYNLNCKFKKKNKNKNSENDLIPKEDQDHEIIGYSIIKIFLEDGLINRTTQIPIVTELPKSNYLMTRELWKNEVKMKNYLQLKINLISSIYPQDPDLNVFFDKYKAQNNSQTVIKNSLVCLDKVRVEYLIQFFPMVIPIVLEMMVDPINKENKTSIFSSFIRLIARVHNFSLETKEDVMRPYFNKIFRPPIIVNQNKNRNKKKKTKKKNKDDNDDDDDDDQEEEQEEEEEEEEEEEKIPFYLELIKLWCWALENEYSFLIKGEEYMNCNYILFEMIIKSITIHLDTLNFLKPNNNFRSKLINPRFFTCLKKLTNLIIIEIKRSGYTIGKTLNLEIAIFFKDLFSLIDRGYVFQLIDFYLKNLIPRDKSEVSIMEFRPYFLRVLTNYEYFIQLNLPVLPSLRKENKIQKLLSKKFFLIGLLMNELSLGLSGNRTEVVRKSIISLIRDSLNRHWIDPFLRDSRAMAKRTRQKRQKGKQQLESSNNNSNNNGKMLSRTLSLYLPFILTLIEKFDYIKKVLLLEEKRNLFISLLFILRYIERKFLFEWWGREALRKKLEFWDLILECLNAFLYKGKTELNNQAKLKLSKKNSSTSASVVDFKEMIEGDYGHGAFATSRSKKKRIENRRNKASKLNLLPFNFTKKNKHKNVHAITRKATRTMVTRPLLFDDLEREQNLCNQCSLTIIDLIVDFMQNFQEELSQEDPRDDRSLLPKMINILITISKSEQSNQLLDHLFHCFTILLERFSGVIFATGSEIVKDLCEVAFLKAISKIPQIRKLGNALLYRILHRGYTTSKNFQQVKIQMIIAFSKLVGDIDHFNGDREIKNTLNVLQQLALSEIDPVNGIEILDHGSNNKKSRMQQKKRKKQKQKSYSMNTIGSPLTKKRKKFIHVVKLHCNNLGNIFEDSKKLRKCKHDPEMTCDLLLSIADGYRSAPDLRVTWLENLVKYHIDNDNFAEGGIGNLHIAAMVSEYVHILNPNDNWLPKGAKSFKKISESCLNESCHLTSEEIGGLCNSSWFTEKGLIDGLIGGINLLKTPKLYEMIADVYKLLIPIFEYRNDLKNISVAYNDLKNCYDELIENDFTKKKRMFAHYYRVGFYGKVFGEMNNSEFIYRELPEVTLYDLKERLIKQFEMGIKNCKIKVFPSSAPVDRESLEEFDNMKNSLGWLQITSVQPYYTDEEIIWRRTHFQRMNHISRFTYQTPFTKSGKKAQGAVTEQWILKAILTVDGKFPYLTKRIKIIEKNLEELSPIMNSINSIKQKNVQLKNELSKTMKDTNNLQGLLRGSLIITVNEGPFAICKAFLGPEARETYSLDEINELKAHFSQFIDLLDEAVKANSILVKTDQVGFQEMLELGITALKENTLPYLKDGNLDIEQIKSVNEKGSNISKALSQSLETEK